MGRLAYTEARWTIGADAVLSAEIDLSDQRIVGIVMPATWDAAAISFQGAAIDPNKRPGSAGDGTEPLQDVYDSAGTQVSVTAVQGHYVALTEAHRNMLACLRRVKLRSGLTGATVNQTGNRLFPT